MASPAKEGVDFILQTLIHPEAMHFQDIILNLQNYWSSKGCALHQPYDIEVGAGTFNPCTFFRVLGPEPYSAAYVEPSRRPADGRYEKTPIGYSIITSFKSS